MHCLNTAFPNSAKWIVVVFCFTISSTALAKKASAQWKLGVTIMDADPHPLVEGVVILTVDPGGPAQRLGIEPNDVIIAINGELVYSVPQTVDRIGNSTGNVQITLRNWRNGRLVDIHALLRRDVGVQLSGNQKNILGPIRQTGQPILPDPARQSTSLAQRQVTLITNYLGMPAIPTFPTAPRNNAVATTMKDGIGRNIPVILYDPEFLNKLYHEHGRWASISVLAHEVAHHFHGDITFYGAFTHPWTKELKADFVSGFVLARAGATRDQATRALKDQFTWIGSNTHPDSIKRIAALEAGWEQGHR